MAHMDVVADLIPRVSEALGGVRVSVHRPEGAPDTMVTLTRSGGRRLDDLRDRVGIRVWCWAPSELEAARLADEVDDVMRHLPFAAGYDRVDTEHMGSDPDPDTRGARWMLSYTITAHVPPQTS